MPESQIVWKFHNQGVRKETFTHTSRRGGDGQPGWRGLEARQWLAEQALPHLKADKLKEELEIERDYATQGSTAGK